MVFYFTATGNSLYAARCFGEELISIPQALKQKNQIYKDSQIGVVCPIYAGELPGIVMEFLKKAEFHTDYFYLILTFGSQATDAPEFVTHALQETGLRVDYIHTIKMVDNYIPVFDMEDEKKQDKQVEEQLAAAVQAVRSRTKGIPAATEEDRQKHRQVAKLFADMPQLNNGEQLTVTDACIGCGICEKVCPIGNFYLCNHKAERKSRTCEFCLACAHNCPQKAIVLEPSEKNPHARYRNEHVSLQEIIAANNQNG